MMQARDASLVVIEYGGIWPRWLSPARADNMVVVAQHYAGAASSLVDQVASRMMRAEATGWELARMALVSNGKTDRESCAVRSILTRGLLARLSLVEQGVLVLISTEVSASRATRELLALGETLKAPASRSGTTVSVRGSHGELLFTTDVALTDPAFARAS